MIKVIINHNKVKDSILLSEKITYAVKSLTGESEWEIIPSSENIGQMFMVKHNDLNHYVAISSMGGGRNTFVFQPFATAYREYLKRANADTTINFLILPTEDKNSRTDYQIFAYRSLLTLGVNIINLSEIDLSLKPFNSLEEMIKSKNSLKTRNKGNISSFVNETSNEVTIYGKLSGANKTESLVLSLTVKKLAQNEGKKIVFSGIQDKEANKVDAKAQGLLLDNSIELVPNISKFEDKTTSVNTNELRKGKYKVNLKNKFGTNSECYLCHCKIPSLMVASHIHRVADIGKSSETEISQKEMSNDGDNGFWLCQNHDKMFEDGLFYFEKDLLIIASYLSNENKNYIFESITKKEGEHFKISPEHYNPKMESYLDLHRKRVNKL